MTLVFRAVLLYLFAALATAGWVYDDFVRLTRDAMVTTAAMGRLMLGMGVFVLPAVLIGVIALGGRHILRRAAPLALVSIAAVLLPIGFSFLKNAIPNLVPYYADPALAAFDNWLHFGTDPWVWTHEVVPASWGRALEIFYLNIWSIVAIIFPIVVVATEHDDARMMRYIWLFFASWLVLGNLTALAGSSVGPVYYDRLLGTERFTDLTAALAAAGIEQTGIGQVQAALWRRYEGGGLDLGLGISAFPSMHLAVATILACYLWERAKWLAPLGFAFVAIIFFVSLWSGYHYAIDGYASILAVVFANRVLARRFARQENERMLRNAAASQLLHSAR